MNDHFRRVHPSTLKKVCLLVLRDLGVEDVALQVHQIRDTEYGVVYDPREDLQPVHEIGIEALKMVADVLTSRYSASVNYIVRYSEKNERYYTYLTVNGEAIGHYFSPDFDYPILTMGDPAKWS